MSSQPHPAHRLLAALAVLATPVVAAALGAYAWRAGQSLGPTTTVAHVVVVAAAAAGALAATALSLSAVAVAVAPRRAAARAARVAPSAWRRLVLVAVSGSLAGGMALPAAAAPPAGWLDGSDTPSAVAPPAGWITEDASPVSSTESSSSEPSSPGPSSPGLSSPGAAGPVAERGVEQRAGQPAPRAQPVGASSAAARIKVAPGDSLWAITARLHGGDAAAVARAWPDLYDANRAVLGEDPGLIHPGVELAIPQGWSR